MTHLHSVVIGRLAVVYGDDAELRVAESHAWEEGRRKYVDRNNRKPLQDELSQSTLQVKVQEGFGNDENQTTTGGQSA